MTFLKLVGRSLRPVPGSRRNFAGGALGNSNTWEAWKAVGWAVGTTSEEGHNLGPDRSLGKGQVREGSWPMSRRQPTLPAAGGASALAVKEDLSGTPESPAAWETSSSS